MEGFTKLFHSILFSTIWEEDDATVRIWVTMMAMVNADGVVEASVPGLARAAHKSIPEVEIALAKFMAPDKYSRTPDFEGRRIEEVSGGWRLLNHDLYKNKLSVEDRREKTRQRVARHRDRKAAEAQQGLPAVAQDVTPGNAGNAPVTPETESNAGNEIRSDQIRGRSDQIRSQSVASGDGQAPTRMVTDVFKALFVKAYGHKPTWNEKTGKQLKRLLAQHKPEEIIRRIGVMFSGRVRFPPPPYDFGSLVQHFDKFAGPAVNGSSQRRAATPSTDHPDDDHLVDPRNL